MTKNNTAIRVFKDQLLYATAGENGSNEMYFSHVYNSFNALVIELTARRTNPRINWLCVFGSRRDRNTPENHCRRAPRAKFPKTVLNIQIGMNKQQHTLSDPKRGEVSRLFNTRYK